MSKFNNNAYEALVSDLIKDAFYIKEHSRRGTISTIRQYAEVIVRKILSLPTEEFVTLGNHNIIKKLKLKSGNNSLLLDSLETIKDIGNKCTHTQELAEIRKEDVNACIDCLFKLYAYLFIPYFEKYRFGCNDEILGAFSILPPIVRYIALGDLYERDESNIMIIDKLALSILKSFNQERALEWLNDRKSTLESMCTISNEAYLGLVEIQGEEVAKHVFDNAPENMYILCIDRIERVGNIIDEHGVLYSDFESAIELYKSKGHIEGDSEEIKEFNSIMEFIYLGRKSIKNNKLEYRDKYIVQH